MKNLALAFAALIALCGTAHAQSTPPLATVVATCGTPPSTYTAGQNRPILQDTSGNGCSSATVGAISSITTVGTITNPVGVKGTDGSTISTTANPFPVTGIGVAQGSTTSGQTLSPIGTESSGTTNIPISCDKHAIYDASDNGLKTVVAGVSSKKTYICGFILATGGTATNLKLTSGTGSDCASTSVAITPAYQLVANDRIGANAAFWNGLITLANADNLCISASAGNAHQVEVWYTIQ